MRCCAPDHNSAFDYSHAQSYKHKHTQTIAHRNSKKCKKRKNEWEASERKVRGWGTEIENCDAFGSGISLFTLFISMLFLHSSALHFNRETEVAETMYKRLTQVFESSMKGRFVESEKFQTDECGDGWKIWWCKLERWKESERWRDKERIKMNMRCARACVVNLLFFYG